MTRFEALSSAGAALFFIAVMSWRFALLENVWFAVCAGLTVLWAAAVLFRLRRESRHRRGARFTAPCLDHYRDELLRRRNHLRSFWVWHGPLLLACVVATAALSSMSSYWHARIGSVLPLVIALGTWTVLTWRRRLRRAAEIGREIEELEAFNEEGR